MMDMEPPVDGIFRAVPNTPGSMLTSGVAPGKAGRWVVTLNLAGELYQAYFDTQEDAQEAFNAAGGISDKSNVDYAAAAQAALAASEAAEAAINAAAAAAAAAGHHVGNGGLPDDGDLE